MTHLKNNLLDIEPKGIKLLHIMFGVFFLAWLSFFVFRVIEGLPRLNERVRVYSMAMEGR